MPLHGMNPAPRARPLPTAGPANPISSRRLPCRRPDWNLAMSLPLPLPSRHAAPPLPPQPNTPSMPPMPGVPLHGPVDVIPPPVKEVPEVEDPPSPESPGGPMKDPPVEPLEDAERQTPRWRMSRTICPAPWLADPPPAMSLLH